MSPETESEAAASYLTLGLLIGLMVAAVVAVVVAWMEEG